MAERILGLDIGSYSIKAALFETTFRTSSLTDLFESVPLQIDELEQPEKNAAITDAILRLLNENNLSPSAVITSLSGIGVSTHRMQLPLTHHQIARVLPFELEGRIPFESSDVVIDQVLIDTSKTSTSLIAGVVRKSMLAQHLAQLQAANIEPAFISLDSLMLANLQTALNISPEQTNVFIDIGHQKTSVCIVSQGSVQFIRTLFLGGLHITTAIRKHLDLTLPQALEVKHKHGVIELASHPLRSEDLKKLSKVVVTVIDPLLQQIQQTFGVYLSQHHKAINLEEGDTRPLIDKVYIAGGTSLITNLASYMTDTLAIPTTTLNLFEDRPDVQMQLGQRTPVFAQAYGTGLKAAARGIQAKSMASFNFRKDEFAFAQDMTGLKQQAWFFSKWILAIFITAITYQTTRYFQLSTERNRVDALIVREVSRLITDTKQKPKSGTAALRLLNSTIEEYGNKQTILTSGLTQDTALGLLRTISTIIPDSTRVDTQELSIDRNKLTWRAHADSFAAVDTIVAQLQTQPKLQTIDIGDRRETQDGKISFTLTITIEDPKKNNKEKDRPRSPRN